MYLVTGILFLECNIELIFRRENRLIMKQLLDLKVFMKCFQNEMK